MVYRLYVATVKQDNKIAWAFTFYNHQDFLVYKRAGVSDCTCENAVILEQSAVALAYFDRSMRRRYYDEHFSTRIDEDYVTLYTELPDIARAAKNVRSNASFTEDEDARCKLLPFFQQKTMSFETAIDKKFIQGAKDLARTKLS